MHDTVAHELRVRECGDHGKDALLLRKTQMRLEADEVVDAALGIVAPELHDGIRLVPGLGVLESAGLEGSKAERIVSAPRHDLNGHTALKNVLILKAVDGSLLRRGERVPEGVVLLRREGAVDVVRRALIVA